MRNPNQTQEQCFEESNGSKCEFCNENTTCQHGIAAYQKYLEQEERVKRKQEERLKRKEGKA